MTEIEVKHRPLLNQGQERFLDLHSVLNVLNIIKMQLDILVMVHPAAQEPLKDLIYPLRAMLDKLGDDEDIEPLLDFAQELSKPLAETLQALVNEATDPEIEEHCVDTANTLKAIFQVLCDRVCELKRRLDCPDPWTEMPIKDLKGMFTDIFDAVEKNANGRYFICYDSEHQSPRHYCVDLKFEAHKEKKFLMPERLVDVLRDLTLNARKYTDPGGTISLRVNQDAKQLSCCIEDSGMGIPGAELGQVCNFGYRASNAGDIETMGGGFGLTKAASAILGWGGRFWIASKEGVGTRIRFEIPNRKFKQGGTPTGSP